MPSWGIVAGLAVGLAVTVAHAQDEDDPVARFKVFLAQGLEVAEKAGLWKSPDNAGQVGGGG